jgi:hypothetical protein
VNLLRKEPQQKTQTVSDNGKYYWYIYSKIYICTK